MAPGERRAAIDSACNGAHESAPEIPPAALLFPFCLSLCFPFFFFLFFFFFFLGLFRASGNARAGVRFSGSRVTLERIARGSRTPARVRASILRSCPADSRSLRAPRVPSASHSRSQPSEGSFVVWSDGGKTERRVG